MSVLSTLRGVLGAAVLALLAASGGGWQASAADANAPAAPAKGPPPIAVGVVTTEAQDMSILNELPGRIAPTRIAEVRPRVSGIVVQRVFEQGSLVKQGDVLYRIDPEPFKVQVDSAKATLQRAEASRLQARQNADRQAQLREQNISSVQQMETATAALAQADADVAAAKAGLAAAELNLHYAEVRAPITGRIGRAAITEGALVGTGAADVLATIQQLDPVYADFTQSVNELRELRQAMKQGAVANANPDEARVRLVFDDGAKYQHAGRLLFSEATVDATTGQVTLRGEFPNPDGELLPGMYVRVLIEQGVLRNAIAVPQQAVQRNASGRAQVFVVKADGTTELRLVRTGRVIGSNWVIEDGLKPGERVVVEGFQKLRPGAPVTPQPWSAGPSEKSAAGPAPQGRGASKAD